MTKKAAAAMWIILQSKGCPRRWKCQKYSRIRELTIAPLSSEPTLNNINTACTNHFNLQEMECDLLAGERGPSYTDISMITTWKVLHIRFISWSKEVCDCSRVQEETGNRAAYSKPREVGAGKTSTGITSAF